MKTTKPMINIHPIAPLSPEACKALIKHAEYKLEPAKVYVGPNRDRVVQPAFRKGSFYEPEWDEHESLVLLEAFLRVLFPDHSYDLDTPQVLRYQVGDFFGPHMDGRERVKTIFIPLNVNYVGGKTKFPNNGFTIQAVVPGWGFIFDGNPIHEAEKVISGEKWSLITWVRRKQA